MDRPTNVLPSTDQWKNRLTKQGVESRSTRLKIMFWINPSLLQTSPHHGFVLNLLHDLIFWVQKRRRTWRTSSRPMRLRWRRRMILMMVEASKSYIWFGGPYEALNHPKSSSRNPCGPNCSPFLLLLPPSSSSFPLPPSPPSSPCTIINGKHPMGGLIFLSRRER